ncbi:hypothetical protein [Salinicola rhizosphaerae]|uniref:Peptidase C39 domain-containing protein n=1 Tax=Salinicola rhizosphaerae TaxID=1443141 RepID=A0ABQ3DVD2_9GAMM|nr:hypothetical protein [Salinicola rhizosphaerae]GHB14239.1 hypothetical protein GCM10009038_10700 [Salinicola rhizosphaerae]
MTPIIQKEPTGCGIAACAALAGLDYDTARTRAAALGIHAADRTLWSQTAHVRALLTELGIEAVAGEQPFTGWDALPDRALLAIKWREIDGVPFWHWVVFVRTAFDAVVLDSKAALKTNVRRDFGRMAPKWFIRIHPT